MNKSKKRAIEALGRLADYLQEAHYEETASKHHGDSGRCSYCVAIKEGREAIAALKGAK